MIRIYRLDELSRRYPSCIWVAESDGWQVRVFNPFSRDYWRQWRSPLFAGMRRAQARWLLALVTVTRFGRLEAPP